MAQCTTGCNTSVTNNNGSGISLSGNGRLLCIRGNFTLTNKTFNFNGGNGSVCIGPGVTIGSNVSFTSNGNQAITITNNGTISSLTLNSNHTLNNESGRTISGITMEGGIINNAGSITGLNSWNGGTINNSGSFVRAGNLTIPGTGTLNNTGTFTLSGNLNINSGGTAFMGGTSTVAGNIINGGTLNGAQDVNTCTTFCPNGSITNNGTVGGSGAGLSLCTSTPGGTLGPRLVARPAAAPTNLQLSNEELTVTGTFTPVAEASTPATQGYVVVRRAGSSPTVTAAQLSSMNPTVGTEINGNKIIARLNGRTNTTFSDAVDEEAQYYYAVFSSSNPANACLNCNNTALQSSLDVSTLPVVFQHFKVQQDQLMWRTLS